MAYQGKNPNLGSTVYDNKGVASVANAPSGKVRIINRDGVLLAQDDTGLESQLGAGTGGGTNYMQNGDFETSITDGVSTTGTAPTITAETADPLAGTQSLKITTGAGTCTVDFAITDIDSYVIDGQIANLASALTKTDGAVVLGHWAYGVYNVTDAEYVIGKTNLDLDTLAFHRAPFVPVDGKTYVQRIEFNDATAGRVLIVDKMVVTPDSNTGLTSHDSGWISKDSDFDSLVTNLPTGSALKKYNYRRDGENMWIYFSIYYTGTTNTDGVASLVEAILPEGLTWNLSLHSGGGSTSNAFGSAAARGPGNSGTTTLEPVIQTVNSMSFTYLDNSAPQDQTPGLFGSDLNATNAGGFSAMIGPIPILEWADSKVNLLTQDVINANSKVRVYVTSAASTGSNSPMVFDTLDFNEGGGFTPDLGTGRITCNFNGYVSAYSRWNVTSAGNTALEIYKDGSPIRQGDRDSDQMDESSVASLLIPVVPGSILDVRRGATHTPVAGIAETYFELARVADYGAFEPIGFGLATDTVAGLVKKKLSKTKELGADISWGTNLGMQTDFSFTTEIGKLYKIEGWWMVTLSSGGDNNFTPNIFHDATVLAVSNRRGTSTSGGLFDIYLSAEFEATTTSVALRSQKDGNGSNTLHGNADAVGSSTVNGPATKATLTLLHDYEDIDSSDLI